MLVLQSKKVQTKAESWGDRIPNDIKVATNTTENTNVADDANHAGYTRDAHGARTHAANMCAH